MQVKTRNHEGESAWSATSTASTQDKNVHSEFPTATTTRSIDENSAAGTAIGAPVTATDTEGHTLTYSLTGMDAAHFSVNATSGQVLVKAALNFEAKATYKVAVGVSDGKDTNDNPDTVVDDTIEVTISVNDVAEPPPAPAAPRVSANAATPTSKLDVSWTAPDVTGKPAITGYDVQYKLSDSSGWTAHAHSGTSTATSIGGLTAGKSYDVRVRAVNDEGNGAWSDSGTAITTANGVSRSVKENSAAGTAIGAPVTATTTGYTYSHALSGTDAASFDIDSATGQLKVKAALDYETKNSYSVVVTVTAASAGVSAASIDPNAPGDYVVPLTITVIDVNDVPAFDDRATTSRAIAENSAAGANIGTPVSGSDQDGHTLAYSLAGTDAASFDISTSSGQLKVKAALDYEDKATYSVIVQVSDGLDDGGNATSTDADIDDTITVSIGVTDVAEPPIAPDAPIATRTAAAPKTSLDVSWTAPDMAGKPAITDYDVRYKQAATTTWSDWTHTGAATTTAITGLEGGRRYAIQVRASNHEGTSDWSDSVSAQTEYKNLPSTFPPSATSTTRSVAENSPAGTNVGAPVTATDNENDPLTYTLSGADAAAFEVNATSGQILVKAHLNYESKKTYSLTVNVSDGKDSENRPDDLIDAKIGVIVNVTDVNDAPTFGEDTASLSVAENTAAGTDIGAPVLASDQDGHALYYSLSGTDAASFSVNENTGQVKAKAALDFEATSTYSLIVRVSDRKDASGKADTAIDDTIAVTVSVTDTKEPPPAPAAPGVSRSSDSPKTKLDVSWTAPDTTGIPPVTDYDVRYRRAGAQSWTEWGFDGIGTSVTLTGLSAGYTYEVIVRAGNDEGEGAWSDSGSASTYNSSPQPDYDVTPSSPLTRSVAENSPSGTKVGKPVTAKTTGTDPLTYTLGGPGAGSFAIDAKTGQITVGAWANLDYETRISYSVTVSASDGSASAADVTMSLTILIADVSEPPDAPGAPSVSQNPSSPRSALDVSWAAPDMTGKPPITGYEVRYRETATGAWKSVSRTSTTTTISGLESGTAYEAQVRASNHEGTSGWSDSGNGLTQSGPASDPTDGDNSDDNDSGGNGGAIEANANAAAPAAAPDVNGAPYFGSATTTRSVAENSPSDSEVGDPVTATDPDGDALTYKLGGVDADSFGVNATSGQILVKAALDYEKKNRYSVIVSVSDGLDAQGNVDVSADDVISVTILVTDVDERVVARRTAGASAGRTLGTAQAEVSNGAPFFGAETATRSVHENSPAGTPLGLPIVAEDPDGDAVRYAIMGADEFAIDAETGQIVVADGAALDHETVSSYRFVVSVLDGRDSQGEPDAEIDATIMVAVHVLDVEESEPVAPVAATADDEPEDAPVTDSPATTNPDHIAVDDEATAEVGGGLPTLTQYALWSLALLGLAVIIPAAIYLRRRLSGQDEDASPA